jgi:hypothetical protein
MAKVKGRNLAQLTRERHREPGLTQRKVTRSVNASAAYVKHPESGKRHSLDEIVARMAKVLGTEDQRLYLLDNPESCQPLDRQASPSAVSGWECFRSDALLRRVYKVTPKEMEMLSQVALLGNIRSSRSFIYILNTIRLTKRAADTAPQERRL